MAIEVVVEERAWLTAEPRARSLVRAAARAVLKHEGTDAALAVLLADDERLRALNRQFRGKDAPTNVLSFPAPAGAGETLGDVALALGVCVREAAEQGKTLAAHLQHLTTHGVLHLLGYDHEADVEAEVMETKERAILAGLGVADPYASQGDHGRHFP
jgi:probable rRNA maturation factor